MTHTLLRRLSVTVELEGFLIEFDIPVVVRKTSRYDYAIIPFASFVVIAVRGTDCLNDWGIDLDALKNHARHGFYHRDFHDDAKDALKLLNDQLGSYEPLYFTGHSLGGAVASILAQDVDRTGPGQKTLCVLLSSLCHKDRARRLARYVYL